jgi:hypothetical protein
VEIGKEQGMKLGNRDLKSKGEFGSQEREGKR